MKFMKQRWLAMGSALALTASLGAPAMAAETNSGISVQLNGTDVAFTDARPVAHSGRTFLPFRTVLEAMGAKVDYKADTQTIVAVKDDATLEMVLGSKDAKLTEDGKTRTITMDTAAYAEANRTYIPVRFAAEAFGCNVGWDQDDQTVIIVDVDKLMGDTTYQLLDKYTAYSAKQAEKGNQAVKGDLSMKLTMSKAITGSDADLSLPVTGTLSGISSQTAGQVKMSMDLSAVAALIGTSESGMTAAQIAALKDQLKKVDVEVRLDMETGMYYIHCPALTQIISGKADENTWYSMDLNQLLAASGTGLDMSTLLSLSKGTAASLKDILTLTL